MKAPRFAAAPRVKWQDEVSSHNEQRKIIAKMDSLICAMIPTVVSQDVLCSGIVEAQLMMSIASNNKLCLCNITARARQASESATMYLQ